MNTRPVTITFDLYQKLATALAAFYAHAEELSGTEFFKSNGGLLAVLAEDVPVIHGENADTVNLNINEVSNLCLLRNALNFTKEDVIGELAIRTGLNDALNEVDAIVSIPDDEPLIPRTRMRGEEEGNDGWVGRRGGGNGYRGLRY